MRELEFAKRIAVRAGDFLFRRQGGLRSIRSKGDPGNLVTDMDRASEKMIVSALRREFPDHAVVAEEGGAKGDSPHRWYVDPLDGTTNYAHSLPLYGVTIAYEFRGRMEAGAIYMPAFGDLYWARRGGGAFRNRRPIRVSATARLGDALLCTGFPYNLKHRMQNLRYFTGFLPVAQAIRRPGAASLDLAWTACGAFDGFWEFRLCPWDMAAGVLIIEEAGGRVSNLAGGGFDLFDGQIVAANPRIHRQMLAVFRRCRLY